MSEAGSAGAPVRLLQIGMGFFGRSWATDIVAADPDVSPVGWLDTQAEAIDAFEAACPAAAGRCFTDFEEAMARTECDAVLITTSAPSHYPLALQALERGKHVLVEKPFTETIDQARRLVAEAGRRALVIAVSQNYRHHPAIRKAAELLRGGSLGPLVSVAITFRNNAGRFPNFGSYAVEDLLLADLAIHHFDQLRFLTGREADQLSCRTWSLPQSRFRSAPSAAATIVLNDGAIVSYQGSWAAHAPETPYGGEWIVECAEGALVFETRWRVAHPRAGDRLMLARLGEDAEEIPLAPLRHVDRSGTLAAFVHAVRTGRAPEGFSSGADNLGSLAILDAARRSAAQDGRRILLGEAFA